MIDEGVTQSEFFAYANRRINKCGDIYYHKWTYCYNKVAEQFRYFTGIWGDNVQKHIHADDRAAVKVKQHYLETAVNHNR